MVVTRNCTIADDIIVNQHVSQIRISVDLMTKKENLPSLINSNAKNRDNAESNRSQSPKHRFDNQ